MERKHFVSSIVLIVLGISAGNLLRHAVTGGDILDWINAIIVFIIAILYIALGDKE